VALGNRTRNERDFLFVSLLAQILPSRFLFAQFSWIPNWIRAIPGADSRSDYEPVLAPLRKIVPMIGFMDITPLWR